MLKARPGVFVAGEGFLGAAVDPEGAEVRERRIEYPPFEALRLLQDFGKKAHSLHPLLADALNPRRERQDRAA